jgi:hypothetical protein
MGVDSRLALAFFQGWWVRMFGGSVLGSHLNDAEVWFVAIAVCFIDKGSKWQSHW